MFIATKEINGVPCIEANGSVNVNDKYYPVPVDLARALKNKSNPNNYKYIKNGEWTDEPPADSLTKKLYDDAWENVINKRKW